MLCYSCTLCTEHIQKHKPPPDVFKNSNVIRSRIVYGTLDNLKTKVQPVYAMYMQCVACCDLTLTDRAKSILIG